MKCKKRAHNAVMSSWSVSDGVKKGTLQNDCKINTTINCKPFTADHVLVTISAAPSKWEVYQH